MSQSLYASNRQNDIKIENSYSEIFWQLINVPTPLEGGGTIYSMGFFVQTILNIYRTEL